ncbi:MAG: NUDIX hydrolase [Bacteroidales bacterium]|nr:NUDIX hydrolase [Bacteroidales bacterium]
MEFYSEYPKFLISTDCIIFGFDKGKLQLLIRKRDFDPGRDSWSLLGGFVNTNESIDQAANRILKNLTGLENIYIQQVGAFGNVDRDPGQRVISVCYYALIKVADYDENIREKYHAVWTPIDELPPLFSDHSVMVEKARIMMQQKFANEPVGFNLLPEKFTLTQLQKLYEAVYGNEIDKRNFRKRLNDMEYIENTGDIDKTTCKRGAKLYRFNTKIYNKQQNFKL